MDIRSRKYISSMKSALLCVTSSLLCALSINARAEAHFGLDGTDTSLLNSTTSVESYSPNIPLTEVSSLDPITRVVSHGTETPLIAPEILEYIKAGDYPTYPLDPRYKSIWVAGIDRNTFIATGADTDGQYTLGDYYVLPQVGGAPPHIHTREDEWFYILDGELTFTLGGDETITATPGTLIYGPRGTSHTFTNLGSSIARMLVEWKPAGIENFFYESSDPVDPSAPFTPPTEPHRVDLHSYAVNYGLIFLGEFPDPVATVPESSSTLGLLAFGAIGAIFTLKRKHKPVSSLAACRSNRKNRPAEWNLRLYDNPNQWLTNLERQVFSL